MGQCHVCVTCGTQFSESDQPPAVCPICTDERQYVTSAGQQWSTLERLGRTHRHTIRQEEPGLIAIGIAPQLAIGQRALLVRTPAGNVLWDCVPLLDPSLVEMVRALGGLAAIAISHPHYYSSMVEWSRALGNVPIYLHAADRQWVMRSDPAIVFWEGETRELAGGLRLVRCGGHFDGGAILHWPDGAGGRGAILSGDILQVVADRKHLSFMYSYPNFIPLPVAAVRRIDAAVATLRYDRIYGAFGESIIDQGGPAAMRRSVDRYCGMIEGRGDLDR